MSRFPTLIAVLALCLLLPACGKKNKLTKGNFDKLYQEMPLKEVEYYLGRGVELSQESKAPPGGSFGAAAGGIALPSDPGGGPKLLGKMAFGTGIKIMQWQEGNRTVQVMFINDKLKVKEKEGF